MTARADAIAYVTLHADTAAHPALTAEEVGVIVDRCAVADADGRAPGAEGWAGAYWVTRAVQRALELRIARAATITDTAVDGTTLAGSQLSAQLSAQARQWARRAAGGPR